MFYWRKWWTPSRSYVRIQNASGRTKKDSIAKKIAHSKNAHVVLYETPPGSTLNDVTVDNFGVPWTVKSLPDERTCGWEKYRKQLEDVSIMVSLLNSFREEVACCRKNEPWPNFCLVAGGQNSLSVAWICWNLAMSQHTHRKSPLLLKCWYRLVSHYYPKW